MILSVPQLTFAHNKALVSCGRVLQKSSQFTRAIRKTASVMPPACAAHFAHEKVQLPFCTTWPRFTCKHAICPQEATRNCEPQIYMNTGFYKVQQLDGLSTLFCVGGSDHIRDLFRDFRRIPWQLRYRQRTASPHRSSASPKAITWAEVMPAAVSTRRALSLEADPGKFNEMGGGGYIRSGIFPAASRRAARSGAVSTALIPSTGAELLRISCPCPGRGDGWPARRRRSGAAGERPPDFPVIRRGIGRPSI